MGIAFDKAFLILLSHEGGYVNNPDDPGGETKFGISKRSYPNLDIQNLTQDEAKAIYLRDFWTPVRGEQLPVPLALVVFDGAVNHGVAPMVTMLQEALYVPADGVMGPITLSAVPRFNMQSLCVQLLTRRAIRYIADPHFGVFGKGWIKRLFDLSADVL